MARKRSAVVSVEKAISDIWSPQPGPQLFATICPARIIGFGGSRGGGKMQPLDAKVLTPKGWVEIGSLAVGDAVTNPETGGSQRVIGVYPQGVLDIYEVVFDDGAKTRVGLEHLWAYKCANRMRPNTKRSKQRDWLLDEFGMDASASGRYSGFRVGTTAELKEELGTGGHDPRIPLTSPVLFDVNGRAGTGAVPPYLIGLLLGDGSISKNGRFLMTTGDAEIAEYLVSLGFNQSGDIPERVTASGVYPSWYLARGQELWRPLYNWANDHGVNGVTGALKFIPKYVFTAGIEYRVSVLRGLLDSDGHVDDRGHIEFSSTSDKLAYGVQQLVWSLGGKATVSEKIVGKYKDKDGQTIIGKEYRRVYIQSNFASKMFCLGRKKERCVDRWNGGRENMRKVSSIELVGREDAVCIKVSSVHGLYVTDDYIVTHNTDCAIGRQIIGAMEYGYKWNGLFIRKSYKYFAELRRRINELIRFGLPAELKGSLHGTNQLRFKNGAVVTLTVVESADKAEFFQGQQYCVAAGTVIRMADGSGKKIESVSVGDMVATLEGPRPVTRVMAPRVSPCVKALGPLGEQIHPIDHPIFSTSGWKSYSSTLGIYSRDAERSSQESSMPRFVEIDAVFVPRTEDRASFRAETPILRCSLSKSSKQLVRKVLFFCNNLSSSFPRKLRQGVFQRLASRCFLGKSHVSLLRACFGVQGGNRVRDFLFRCSSCFRRRGVPFRHTQAGGQETIPFQAGADKRSRDFLGMRRGVRGSIRGCTPLNLSRYEHPYSGKMREVVVQTFSGACRLSPCGDMVVHDLTVDGANHYISHETGFVNKNTEVSIEEACQFPFLDTLIEKLKGCLRSPHGLTCRMFLTANPGGPGHNQFKSRFMPLGVKPGQIILDEVGMSTVFIPSRVEDNKILCNNDPEYVAMLRSIKDPVLRRAWLDGDWDVVLGGFFSDVWNKFRHVVPFFRPPLHWPRIVGMDWGSSTPFSIGWYVVSDGQTSIPECGDRVFPKNSLIRFYEWYGCPRGEANVGIRLSSPDVAKKILEIEDRKRLLGIGSFDRVADPSIFAEKDGPSIAEKFANEGVVWRKGENRRISGWDQVRGLLRGRCIERVTETIQLPNGEDEEQVVSEIWEPMLYVTENCTELIRTLPIQERDETDYEDVETTGEDHVCLSLNTMVIAGGETRLVGELPLAPVISRNGAMAASSGFCITRQRARVVKLIMSDGEEQVCTPDHRFVAKSGLKRCDTLTSTDELMYVDINNQMEDLCQNIKSLWAFAIICAESIIKTKGEGCTGTYGSSTMEKSRPAITFITKTRIVETIASRILSCCTDPVMLRFILRQMRPLRGQEKTCLRLSTLPQRSGTGQRLGLLGIKNSMKKTARARCISIPMLNATIAKKSSDLSKETVEKMEDFALISAGLRQEELRELMTKVESVRNAERSLSLTSIQGSEPAGKLNVGCQRGAKHYWKKVKSVEPVEELMDVGCCYVPGSHTFILASGLISANCDEVRYVAMSRPSVSKTIMEMMRPRQLTENERDFAMAQSIISDGVGSDGLSYPVSVDMGIQEVGVGGMSVFIAK